MAKSMLTNFQDDGRGFVTRACSAPSIHSPGDEIEHPGFPRAGVFLYPNEGGAYSE